MTNRKLPNRIAQAYLALFIANVIWAAAGPVIKMTVGFVPVTYTLLVRLTIASALVLPFLINEVKKSHINKSDYFNFFMLGLFSQTSLWLVFFAYKYTTALDVTIIGILGTMATVFAGHYFYKEKVGRRMIGGMILATIGMMGIVIEPFITSGIESVDALRRFGGNLIAVLYNVIFLLYVIWSKMSMGERSGMLKKTLSFIHLKPMTKTYPPFIITGLSFFVGLLTFIPLAFIAQTGALGVDEVYVPGMLTLKPLLGIIFLAVLSSVVAYLAYQWALNYATVGETSLFYYLEPVLVMPFAYWLLSEIPTTFALACAMVISAGVVIAETHKS